jgi:hypothetical protein
MIHAPSIFLLWGVVKSIPTGAPSIIATGIEYMFAVCEIDYLSGIKKLKEAYRQL